MTKRRALFVSNGLTPYGSGKSLQGLLSCLRDTEVELWVPRGIVPFPRDVTELARSIYGSSVVKAESRCLPISSDYEGAHMVTKHWALERSARIVWRAVQRRTLKYLRAKAFDYIHLNSSVLHPLLDLQLSSPVFMHVREVIHPLSWQIVQRLNRASGLICIDSKTAGQLCGKITALCTTISNPVDMHEVLERKPKVVREHWQIPAGAIVVSMIGHIDRTKGVNFVLEGFSKCQRRDIVLLVAGDDNPKAEYFREFLTLVSRDQRIIYLGFQKDILDVYCISDYIIRGDPDFRIGRTVMEGLYSGCHVIMPSKGDYPVAEPDLMRFRDSFVFYKERDPASLADVLERLSGKVQNRTVGSNMREFSRSFSAFLSQHLEHNDMRMGRNECLGS